jgi:HK97 family phage major capsid protein/HK97 family phage prohead protease
MSDEIKVGRLLRDYQRADITLTRAAEADPLRLSFPASSEAEVERWFGTEVLRHDDKAVRMERIAGGAAPLLFNHDWSDPVGMVTAGRIKDGRLWVDAQLFATQRAGEVAKMIEGGLRNVSIGYEIEEMEEQDKGKRFVATRWLPLEVSIVTVPADASVGVGRSAEFEPKPVRVMRAESEPVAFATSVGSIGMSDQVAATGASVEAKPQADVSVVELETNRRKAIENLCKANNLDVRFASRWISGGASLEKVADEILKVLEERGRENPAAVAEIGLTDREVQQYSLFRMLAAVQSGDFTKAGFEKRCHEAVAANVMKSLGRGAQAENNIFVPAELLKARRDVQRRDLTAASASGGGYLVETQNMSFIELLRNRSVLMNMGATRMQGLVGNVAVPRQTGAATANWMSAEAGTGAAYSDQTFGQLALSPKTVVAGTKISRQLQLQSDPSAESLVMMDLAAQVALAVDSAGLSGSGASGQPTGIINTGSIGGFTGTSITYALLLNSQEDLALANTLNANCGYVSHPAATSILMTRQRFSSTDTPLWEGNMLDGRCVGFRAMSSNQMPSSRLLFGDFAQCVIAEWGVLELAVNPVENFLAGIIGVRAMYSIDIGVRYAGAFSYASNNVT